MGLAGSRSVGNPIGDAGIRRLQELLATPPRVRMPCMLIYGVSGAGKSMLLEKFQRDHAQICERRSGRRMIVATRLPPVHLLPCSAREQRAALNAIKHLANKLRVPLSAETGAPFSSATSRGVPNALVLRSIRVASS
jgi:hypothetical protein